MGKIVLAWQNRIDAATLSGGDWLASLPRANLAHRQVQRVARTASLATADTQFDVDLGQARRIGVLALVVHNLSVSATARVRAAATADFAAPLYDSGWVEVWPSGLIPQELLEWEDDNFWLGTLSEEARAGYQSPWIHLLAETTARYWRVEIDDAANADGYVQIGRAFLAATWTPTANFSYGAAPVYEDPSSFEASLSGAEYFDLRSRYRVFSFSLDWLSPTEAYAQALELQRLCGSTGEVLVIPDPDDAVNQTRRNFVGRLRRLSPIPHRSLNFYSTSYELKELL